MYIKKLKIGDVELENNILLAFEYIAGEAQLGLGECSFIKKYNSVLVYIILS